ncbi:AbiJ-NTD4 domain-containing protein [Patiriisocius hiemis]|uniref:HEPN AbiJ-N-terminal domain-containing protein n=1 Tax=Patiriisocius hiemis TaxID=3075604 RepID=A0ABU2YDE4_9FLAO|nr:hypothetical protein [Constantimarinum sp. W242]MDT0556209.1 hypothetical protein [Constantimarinum sp. W242]
MKFSQRIGKTDVRESIQIESIDEKLSNRLWNTLLRDFFNHLSTYSDHSSDSYKGKVLLMIWTEYFGNRSDKIESFDNGYVYTAGTMNYISQYFFSAKWYEKYDFIEFMAALDEAITNYGLTVHLNSALEQEMAGYRIVEDKIIQITSAEEISAIEEAINNSQWEPVKKHLSSALEFLSHRENPDYRNSVKESISAVESLCIIITGDKKTTLGKALSIIESTYKIHGALKQAFSSLYGYTSDSGGIRHSLLEDDIEVTMEDAKFMLVSCSAFINYLKVKIK